MVPTKRSAIALARGARTGVLMTLPFGGRHPRPCVRRQVDGRIDRSGRRRDDPEGLTGPLRPVGAENSVTLCDLRVFVDEPAEPVSSQAAGWWRRGPMGAACGRLLVEGSMRAVGVVMLDVLAEHGCEMPWAGDEDLIEAFTAQTPDAPFRDRVRSRCPHWGADDADVRAGEDRVEGGGELAVPVADQKPEPRSVITQVHEYVAGLLSHPGPGGMGGDPGDVHATAAVSITTRI